MTIELTQEQEALIQKHLSTGHYHSRVEVLHDALALLDDQTQLDQAKLKRLHTEVQKGLESGEPEIMDIEAIIAEANERYDQRSTR